MKRIINNLTPQKQQYEIIKNKILTLKNWTRAFHRSSLLYAGILIQWSLVFRIVNYKMIKATYWFR